MQAIERLAKDDDPSLRLIKGAATLWPEHFYANHWLPKGELASSGWSIEQSALLPFLQKLGLDLPFAEAMRKRFFEDGLLRQTQQNWEQVASTHEAKFARTLYAEGAALLGAALRQHDMLLAAPATTSSPRRSASQVLA